MFDEIKSRLNEFIDKFDGIKQTYDSRLACMENDNG